MVNTELHNILIEKEILNKIIESDKINQIAKTALMREKLKSVLLIIGVVFIVLLMLIFLYWIFPSKVSSKSEANTQESECKETPNKFEDTITSTTDEPAKTINPLRNDIDNKRVLKNGVDYVKHDNHVFKRTWKDGSLTQEKRLEQTIKESREKSKESIPQLAAPK